MSDNGSMTGEGMQDMGGMVMGDMAEVTVAGEAELDTLPGQPLAWVGYRIDEASGGSDTYTWGPAFLYADDEARSLEVNGEDVALQAREAVFVGDGVEHSSAGDGSWVFRLTDPDDTPPAGLDDATQTLSSGPLEGLPDRAEIRFLLVELPPNTGQTTVHTHPGPEFISVTHGEIEYETDLAETTRLAAGDAASLPAGTAVQKRNIEEEPARFWSWFIIDPDEPFASEATFDRG